ncbi:MAG: hypothetical protein ABS79_01315 [Planctomycetes bacterium SCN 63-9]|nr:MAG: hypothetical protein ABS79_01315 [Planctomycetes bacterium SCN 63-9]
MYRDRDIRRAIASILEATREFDGVYLRSVSEIPSLRAGDIRAVSIEPDSVDFSDSLGDGGANPGSDSGALIVSGRLNLTFMVRDDEPVSRDEAAEQLVTIASNALNDQSLASLTMPPFTRFLSLKWLTPEPPERRISATFVYRYAVDSWTSFDTTE